MKSIFAVSSTYFMRTLAAKLIILSSVVLSACSIPTINTQPFNSYTIDPYTGAYCKGFVDIKRKGLCHNLLPVSFAHHEFKVIENIYQQQIKEPNRVDSLIKIITAGDNIDYQATVEESGLFRLPSNQQTDTVWNVLTKIDRETYLK